MSSVVFDSIMIISGLESGGVKAASLGEVSFENVIHRILMAMAGHNFRA